jgi:hypothetical protein
MKTVCVMCSHGSKDGWQETSATVGSSSASKSKVGFIMNLIKPISAEETIVVALSHKTDTGSPSSFSQSPCESQKSMFSKQLRCYLARNGMAYLLKEFREDTSSPDCSEILRLCLHESINILKKT